jgi:hypothetical protein
LPVQAFTQEEANLFAQSCVADANGNMSLADFAAMECWKLPPLRKAGAKTRRGVANVEPNLAGATPRAEYTPRAAEKKRNLSRPGSALVEEAGVGQVFHGHAVVAEV